MYIVYILLAGLFYRSQPLVTVITEYKQANQGLLVHCSPKLNTKKLNIIQA